MIETNRIKTLAGLIADNNDVAKEDYELKATDTVVDEVPAEKTAEAVGQFADPIYDLCDELGCEAEHPVYSDLIRYLDGDTIKDFVDEYRRVHDFGNGVENPEESKTQESGMSRMDAEFQEMEPKVDALKGKLMDGGMEPEDAQDEAADKLGLNPDLYGEWKDHKYSESQELEEEPNEGNEFSGELAKAKKAGKKEFKVGDKTYKVESEETDKEAETIEEAPTMDTTQLITLLKNSGIDKEAIDKKIDEWANTPEGVGEIEPRVHGGDDNYEFAQAVNLSLKKYLKAKDMGVSVNEGHTVEDMKAQYKAKKESQK